MLMFNALAKLTHARYGPNSWAARGCSRRVVTINPMMQNQTAAMTTTAGHNCRSPKNIGVHAALSTICATHQVVARLRIVGARQASVPAMAIITYNTVHTGPNNQPGGFQLGLCSAANHAPGANKPPSAAAPNAPAPNQIQSKRFVDTPQHSASLQIGQHASDASGYWSSDPQRSA